MASVLVFKLEIDNERSIKSMKELVDYQKELKKRILAATDTGTKEFEEMRKAIKSNQKVITEFNRDLRNSKSIAQRVSEGVTKSFKQVGAVIAGAFAISAIGDFGRAIVELTSTIEDGFARVNTVAQLTQEELDDLKDRAIEIGKQGSTELEKIPDALFDIISGTGDTELSMELLEQSILATDAGFGDLGSTAQAGVNILNAVGREAIETNEVFDILFATQKEGVVSFDQLAKILPNVIPSAKAVGFTFEETSSALATLTKQGLDATAAGTSLRAFFSSFTNKAKLEKMNETLGTVGSSVFDAEGKLRNLTDIVADFDKVLESASSDEERAKILGDLKLDQNSVKALQGLTAGMEDFVQVSESIGTASDGLGELQKQLALSENGTRSIGKANNAFKAELLELGQEITPLVEEAQIRLYETGQVLLEGLNDTIQFFKENETAAKLLKGSFAVLAAFISSKLITTIVSFTAKTKLLSRGLLLLRSPIATILNLMTKFLTIAKANPLGVLITGVTAAVVLFDAFNESAAIASSITEEFSANSDQLAGKVDALNAEMAKEINTSNQLFEALKDTNTSQEDRVLIINQINEQYGEYLPHLLTEESSLKAIEAAQRAVNAELTRNFTLKIQEATQADALTEKIKFQQEAFKQLTEAAGNSGQDLGNSFVQFQKIIESLSDSSDDMNSTIRTALTGFSFDVFDTGSEQVNDLVRSLTKVSDESVNMVSTLSDGSQVINSLKVSEFLDKVARDTGKFNEAINASSETINQLTGSVVGANTAIEGTGTAVKKTGATVTAEAKKIEDQYKRLLDVITQTEETTIKTARATFIERKQFFEELLDSSNLSELERFKLLEQLSEEEKRLKLVVRDATKKSLDDQLDLAKDFSKDSKALKANLNLEQKKNESEFVDFNIKERKRLETEKKRIANKEFEAGLIRLGSEMESAEREIKIFSEKFKKREKVLRDSKVGEEQIQQEKNEGINAIQESFGLKAIDATERIEKAKALIEFSQGQRSADSKEEFEKAKLEATLRRQRAELQLLEELGSADEVRIEELKASISSLSAHIEDEFKDAGFSFKAFTDGFSNFAGKAQEFSGKLQEIFNLNTELALQGLDRQSERAQQNVDKVQSELNNVNDRIATANATQRAALEQEKEEIQDRFDAEAKGAAKLEEEKEQLRKEAFERNQTFSIISAVINGALAVTKAIAELGPIAGPIAGAITAGITAAQIALIAGQKFALGGLVDADKDYATKLYTYANGGSIPVSFPSKRGGMIKGPSHDQGGVKFAAGGQLMEAQGGEFISSRPTTQMFLPVLKSLNNIGNRLGTNTGISRVPSFTKVPAPSHFAAGGLVTTAFVTRAEFADFVDKTVSQNGQVAALLVQSNALLAQGRKIYFSMSEFTKKQLEFQDGENGDDD